MTRLAILVRALWGAQIAGHVLATKVLRRRRTSWGATTAEAETAMPGDELIPHSRWGYTHAVTIDATPEQVWPWIAQLGQGRGGFDSDQGLENLIGCRVHNTDTILPDNQKLGVGDGVRLHPKAPPLTVAVVEPNSRLVLRGANPDTGYASIWAFHLLRVDDRHTRLIERGRGNYGPTVSSRLTFGPLLLEPIGFVMSRKMLLTIRDLAGGPTRATRPRSL